MNPSTQSGPKSLTVITQITRADGTVEPAKVAAYMDTDPEEMRAVLAGEKLPATAVQEVAQPHVVEGRVTHGSLAVDLLNSASPEDAPKIAKMNERSDEDAAGGSAAH